MPLEANIIIKKQWILSPLRGSRMTGYGMTFGGFRGCPPRRGGGEQRSASQGETSPVKNKKKETALVGGFV